MSRDVGALRAEAAQRDHAGQCDIAPHGQVTVSHLASRCPALVTRGADASDERAVLCTR